MPSLVAMADLLVALGALAWPAFRAQWEDALSGSEYAFMYGGLVTLPWLIIAAQRYSLGLHGCA